MKILKLIEKYPYLLIITLVAFRLIPHPPNFTPLIATAVICGFFYRNIFLTSFIVILSMFLSDLLLGLHANMFYVYASILLINFLVSILKISKNLINLFMICILSSIMFYLITNFAMWMNSGLYVHDISGLINCYILALPFFTNTLISTIFYSTIVFYIIKNFDDNKYLKVKNA